jgi:hypothetical protein
MKSIIILLLMLCGISAIAQPTSDRGWYNKKDIEKTDIGWINVLQFKEPAKPFSQNGWTYSAKQIEFGQKMATWVQQTYLPKGVLGEMKVSVYAQPPSAPMSSSSYVFNEAEKNNRNALPNTYGTNAKMYMLLQKTSTKKFWPIDGLADYMPWNIMANNVELITHQFVYLSSPDEYYFTQPRYTIGMKGEYDSDFIAGYANYRNFTNSPALKKYDHYLIPRRTVDAGNTFYYTVIMTKDGKPLPFEQVTVGELINRLEKQLPMMHKIALNQQTRVDNLLGNAQRGIKLLREKYSKQLNDFAYVSSLSTDISILELAGVEPNKDVHWLYTQAESKNNQGYVSNNFPILRLKKGVKEALATGEPQWIVFRLAKGVDPGNYGEIYLMETFMNRFNYDYVYDYYFGKDKVIKPYQPVNFVNEDDNNNAKSPAVASEASKKMATDKSVVYFEDFSTTANGAAPSGWSTERSSVTGEGVRVTEIAGTKGKWLRLKGKAVPAKLTASGDFTISFDLLVQKGDVPWGTPGIQLQLKKDKYQFVIDVSPGDMNRKKAAGWVMINHYMPDGYNDCKIGSYYSLPDFSGDEQVNRTTMAIQRKGERVAVLCNGQEVFACTKGIPADMSFNDIRFVVNEKNVYHISNILIKK